jgi:hypothetical protein
LPLDFWNRSSGLGVQSCDFTLLVFAEDAARGSVSFRFHRFSELNFCVGAGVVEFFVSAIQLSFVSLKCSDAAALRV